MADIMNLAAFVGVIKASFLAAALFRLLHTILRFLRRNRYGNTSIFLFPAKHPEDGHDDDQP